MSNIVTGRQLRAARIFAGLTQKQLAKAVGVHERAARYWESKEDKAPTSTPDTFDDCGRFLDEGWAKRRGRAWVGPLDLFGCDRERPFDRIDELGLLWMLKGGTVVELHRNRAILQTASGATQTYRRRPVEVGRVVLAWELIP
jgi:transcriptional regulator with XRE-family HTH domain